MKRPLPVFTFLFLSLLTLTAAAQPGDPGSPASLSRPVFTPVDDQTVHQTDVRMVLQHSNTGAATEIYRSTSAEDGFVLIHTETENIQFGYVDSDLKPRTTFYYKARAINGTERSEFSDVWIVTTMSKFYPPTLTATVNEDLSVQIRFDDRSYHDNFYEIFRRTEGQADDVLLEEHTMLDSGDVIFINDAPDPGGTYEYYVNAGVMDEGMPTYVEAASITVTIPSLLVAPTFSSAGFPVYENNIIFGISNPNDGSETQIYRSLTTDGPFQLIATVPYDEIAYQDSNLKPRTTFYYKLLASQVQQVSEFSETRSFTSGSKFYAPQITGVGNTSSIDLTFTDRSYDDVSYSIWRSEEGSTSGEQIKSIVASDSGQVFHFTDTGLAPNTSYNYRVDANTKGPNNPSYTNVASVTVSTGDEIIAPEFTTPDQIPCGKAVAFGVLNYNPDAEVEIYRSLSESDGFTLRYTLSPEQDNYVDDSISPRTTYYYKLRAVRDGSSSEFSEVLALTSGSTFYNPVLDGDRGEPGTIQLTFHDRSYADGSYLIYKTFKGPDEELTTELLQELILPDSGSSSTIIDTLNSDSGEFKYSVDVVLACEGQPVYYNVAGDTLYLFPNVLIDPYIDATTFAGEHCGDRIAFLFSNENEGTETEIWRSATYDGEYAMIAMTGEDGIFSDSTVVPGEKYFYKLRAASMGEVSEFSEAWEFTAEPKFYQPNLYVFYTDEGVEIEIQVEDHSDLERSYDFYVTEQGADFPIYYEPINSEGSGTITSIKNYPIPGRTYVYSVDMVLECGANDVLVQNVASQTFEVPDGPAVYELMLVDPYTDEDVRKLLLLDGGFDAQSRYNIRAVTNGLTQSVEFHLNGVRIWGENQEPYALFGDRNGNFNPGRLKPGQYTLTATAYGSNLQKGKKGNTIAANFEVYDNGTMSLLTSGPSENVQMNIFPNPVVSHAEIEISGQPNENVNMQLIDETGNPVGLITDVLDDDGLLLKQWDLSTLRKGTYFMHVKTKDGKTTQRIIVE